MNANGRSVRRLHGLLLVLFVVLTAPRVVNAIDWNAGATIENTSYTDGGTHYIKIKGDVNMNGYIQVGNGTTLYVEIADGVAGPVKLTNTGSAESFFRVYQTSKLIIRGKDDGHRIILDGGSVGSTDKSTKYEMIGTAGTLDMQYVTVQNNHQTSTIFNGVIKINPGWEGSQELGTTTIKNCSFINCSAAAGSVLFTDAEKDPRANPKNTPTSCAIWMEDVLIDGCKANDADGKPSSNPAEDTDPGSGWAGILRFRGGWLGNFTMKHVEIKNCSAEYSCAGVFWNAMGVPKDPDRQPKLTVIGCKFHDNHCKRSGGAMRIETFCEFKDEVTEIYNNTAGIMGGGIHMYGYSAGNLGQFDFEYYLTDMLYIHDNTAQYGGGLGFQLNNCQLEAGSTFNLHFNGAKINNNHATVKGGGVYLENRSDAAKNYMINFYLNSGELNDNQVYKDNNEAWDSWWSGTFYDTKNSGGTVTAEEDYKSCGGAVYVYNSNIGYEPGAAGTLTMKNNRCMRRGGAVCVTGTGASVNLSSLTASGNKAQDGGGLASMSPYGTAEADYSTLTLGNLQLTKCTCQWGWGGGVFMERGKLVVNDNATISGSSAPYGGGIHCRERSIVTINSATIENNEAIATADDYGGLGGGIYLTGGSQLTVNGSVTISGNKAHKYEGGTSLERGLGGAIYCDGGSTLNLVSATISGNTADNFGGGVCSFGSTNKIGKATFLGNVAGINGGGIYLEKGGSLEITTGAEFTNNIATRDGGGAICAKVYHNTAEEYITGNIKNATFRGNRAYDGGAIELDGEDDPNSLKFTLENNVMENNVAKLGGAVLVYEATLNYNGGKIRWNRAEYVEGGPKTSFGYYPFSWANYNADYKFSGFGGGIIVAKDGVLNISKEHPFGIYENHADIGGNDISTICSDAEKYKDTGSLMNTEIFYPHTLNIPKADNLDLSGFEVPVPRSAISWMEDYNAADGAYSVAGTHKLSSPQRYSDLLKTADGMKQLSMAMVNPEAASTPKYLHLTMGYNFVFVKLKKSGLKPGDTAIFRVWYKPTDGEYQQYMDFTITGKEGFDEVEKTIALTVGKWKIGETDWAYTYTRPDDQEFELKPEDALSETVKTLSFSNKKNENMHDAESTKVNKIEIK